MPSLCHLLELLILGICTEELRWYGVWEDNQPSWEKKLSSRNDDEKREGNELEEV
jgi:hypothetical protein